MKAPSVRIHGWPRLFLDIAGLSLGFACAGLALRLTLRDWVPGLAALYYLTPGVVIAAAFAVSSLAAGAARRWRWCWTCLGLSLGIGAAWTWQNWVRPPPDRAATAPGERPGIRLLFWNLGGPYAEWDALGRAAKAQQPDIAAFSEAKIVGGTRFTLADNWFPGHHFWQNNQGLMVFSRWPLENPESGRSPGRHRWATLVVRHPYGPFRLALADLVSNPLHPRRVQIADWRTCTIRPDGLPEVVAGDFNTPFDSVWFRDLKATHLHAFTTAGSGLHVTWPFPLPVLALDHVWCRGLTPTRAERSFSPLSDHASLLVEMALSGK